MAAVRLDGISKVFPDGTRALVELELEIADGEFLVLVGPSGCGKTTALKIAAGLEQPTSGRVFIGDRDVTETPAGRRDVAMVFQNYALYPHMTVGDNMGFGLRMRKMPRAEVKRKVDAVARTLGLTDVIERRPRQLSGGQRQRVAMGRAIVREPQVFLMDEPLSNLDARLRVEMRAEIARIQRELNVTTMYVTHDQIEAMTMGHRVAVMRKGVLQQVATPREVYRNPSNLFVASFIGSPAMNLVEADVTEIDGGRVACTIGDSTMPLPIELAKELRLVEFVGGTVYVGIRPEHLAPAHPIGLDDHWRLTGTTALVEELGSDVVLHLEIAARPVVTGEVVEIAQDADPTVAAGVIAEAGSERAVLVARLDGEAMLDRGSSADLSIDPRRIYFFDPATGVPIRSRVCDMPQSSASEPSP